MRLTLFISLLLLISACAPSEKVTDPPVVMLSIETSEPELIAWEVTPAPTNAGEDLLAVLPTATPQPVRTPTPLPGLLVTPPPGLVYRWNDGLWRTDPSGLPLFLLDLAGVETVSLSQNGSLAIFHREGQVWVADLMTSVQLPLRPEEGYSVACEAWWPNRPDIVLAFTAPVAEEAGLHNGCQGRPAAFNVEGEFLRYLAPGRNDYGPLAASSDEKTIVFDQGGEPWIYRSGIGSKAFTPFSYNFPKFTETSFFYPEFSSGGERLAWLIRANINGVWQTGIGIFRLEEKKARFLHPYPIWSVEGEMSRMEWSPDENFLVLYNYAARQLWVIRADGSQVYSSTALSGFAPVWSPTGDWLAYPVFSEKVGGFVLTLLRASDAQAWQPQTVYASCEALTRCECSRIRSLVWHPDGSWLVMSQELLSSEPVNWLIEPETGGSARIDLPAGAVVLDWIVENSEPVE